jgi:hypothetical protein
MSILAFDVRDADWGERAALGVSGAALSLLSSMGLDIVIMVIIHRPQHLRP